MWLNWFNHYKNRSWRVYRYWYFSLGLGLGLTLAYHNNWAVDTALPRESQLKAVYLYRFAMFVNWPETTFKETQSPLTICVLGQHPFGKALSLAIAKEKINSHSIEVYYLNHWTPEAGCHILFLSPSESEQREEILASLKGQPILTVSDMKNFVTQGGMIEFYTRGNKVRFLVNPDLIKAAGLQVSANLLAVGDVVNQ